MKSDNPLSMSGKVLVVTGAASGIGLATAQLFGEYGAAVAMLDINAEAGSREAEALKQKGYQATFFPCDVTSREACEQTVGKIVETYGRIDVLFNNAGIVRRKTVLNLDEADWDLTVDVTIKGAYLLSKYVIPVMIESGGGSIVNTGSGWGLKGGADAVAYCAAKGGIVNMTRAMALDHGKDNIRVNSVCPGDIDTPLLHDEAVQLGQDDAEFMEEAADRPLRRVGQPRDVANTVLFLASDLSSWITGTSILVDGGGLA